MIYLLVTYRAEDEETLENFYTELLEKKIGEKSRAEEGNIKYDYFLSLEKDNELLLTEIWKDEEALAVHGETEHLKQAKELGLKYRLDVDVIRI